MADLPRRQRIAAYAVIIRDDRILLSRLAPWIAKDELWALPGGGLDHGEDPRDAVVREIYEETGLEAAVSETARVYSAHLPSTHRGGRRFDYHALRIVYDGWVPTDAPDPHVVEVGGSTVEARWHPIDDLKQGLTAVTHMVTEALADYEPFRLQRLAAYAVLLRRTDAGPEVLLTRISERGFHAGAWTLPGGGVAHGESPAQALAREVTEECGVTVRINGVLGVHDVHFDGTAPSGRFEDFHGIHLIFEASVIGSDEPRVLETGGTTDAAAWVGVHDIRTGRIEVLDLVQEALGLRGGRDGG